MLLLLLLLGMVWVLVLWWRRRSHGNHGRHLVWMLLSLLLLLRMLRRLLVRWKLVWIVVVRLWWIKGLVLCMMGMRVRLHVSHSSHAAHAHSATLLLLLLLLWVGHVHLSHPHQSVRLHGWKLSNSHARRLVTPHANAVANNGPTSFVHVVGIMLLLLRVLLLLLLLLVAMIVVVVLFHFDSASKMTIDRSIAVLVCGFEKWVFLASCP